jgi:hypothetical protein
MTFSPTKCWPIWGVWLDRAEAANDPPAMLVLI